MFFSCNAIDPFFFEAVIFSLQSWGHSHKKLLLQYDLWMGDGIFLLWFKYRVSHYACDIYYWMFILLLFKTSKCTEWVIMYVTYTNNKLILELKEKVQNKENMNIIIFFSINFSIFTTNLMRIKLLRGISFLTKLEFLNNTMISYF